MSNRNNLIIAIQDNVTALNVSTMVFSVSVVLFFISLVLAFIMRKELKKSLSNGVFTPNSKAPDRFRMMFFVFLVLSVLMLVVSGNFFFKVQGLKSVLAEQQMMLENTITSEKMAQNERERLQPISAEEINVIKKGVEDDLKKFQDRLLAQAKSIAEKNPNTTVDAEYEKLLAEYKGPVVTDRPIPTERPTHEQLKREADQNVSVLINAILEEPVRQIEADKAKN